MSPSPVRDRSDDEEPPSPPLEAPPPPPASHHERRSSHFEPRRKERDYDREGDRDRDADHGRYKERDREARPDEGRHRRQGDYERKSNNNIESRNRPAERVPRPRDPRKPPPSPSRRQSITEKIKSSWGGILRDNSVTRRSSTTSATRSDPVLKIRTWLERCNTDHGKHCHDAGAKDLTFLPVWLIDCSTADAKLVRAHPDDDYVALSYVWEPPGRRPTVMTRANNVARFEQKLPVEDLPQTIKEAMWLTRRLGLSLLWVDRLCIVQDDEPEKDKHVRNMAYVFANAYLTIVAACGNANARLGGLDKRSSVPKSSKASNVSHLDLVAESKWNTRAWTVEEALYARRAVYVFNDSVTWECHCDVFEGGPQSRLKILKGNSTPKCTTRLGSAQLAFQHSPWPDLDDYARIVMDYSMRRLSAIEDTPRAFAGVTSVLSKVFTGGFVWGMPVMFLEVALLWQPQISIRRKTLPLGSSYLNALPSWSWMGWYFDDIPVELLLWRAAADYVESSSPVKRGAPSRRFQSPNHFRIRSLNIEWNLTDRTTTTRLVSDGLQYRGKSFRKGATLPEGWTRVGYDYKHEADPNTFFRYPIPVPPMSGPEQLVMAPTLPGTFLSFTTTRGFFDVEISRNQAFKARTNPPIAIGNIYDRSGRWSGQFRSHDSWLGIQSSNHDGDEKLEFIAISEASERGGSHVFDGEFLRDVQDADGIVDFVNVLWIERIGEIAYRRGLGHIVLQTWSAQAKEQVPILLG